MKKVQFNLDFSQFALISFFVIGIISLIPIIFAFRVYITLRLTEYIYFILFWFSCMITSFLLSIYRNPNSLIYWKLLEFNIVIFYYLIFLQGIRLINFKSKLTYRLSIAIGLTFAIFLTFLIIQWKLVNTNNYKYIFPSIPSQPNYSGITGGLLINGKIFYSSGFNLIRQVFGLIAFLTFFYAYWSTKPVYATKNVIKAQRIWQLASISGLIFYLITTLWIFFPKLPQINVLFALITALLVVLIAFKYPEGFALSESQVYRLFHLYRIVGKSTKKQSFENSLDKIQDLSQVKEYLFEISKIIDLENQE